jgi:hypothetical protein
LTLSRDLLRRGFITTIYERSPPLTDGRSHNYGITINDKSSTVLGILTDTGANLSFHTSVDHEWSHIEPWVNGKRSLDDYGGQIRAYRARLEGLLANDLDIRWEHDLYPVGPKTANRDSTKLSFKNGH